MSIMDFILAHPGPETEADRGVRAAAEEESAWRRNPHAVFVVARVGDGFAATTRAADRGEAGRIGFPGGKVDAGETPRDAAIREAAEEGWEVEDVAAWPFHADLIEGRPVAWFSAASATPLPEYKERARGIIPVVLSAAVMAASGYGNDDAVAAFRYSAHGVLS
jgi:hypothetical protein